MARSSKLDEIFIDHRRLSRNERGSLFQAARPSVYSQEAMRNMSPADRLVHTLSKYLPNSYIRPIEEKANELLHFLEVDQLPAFLQMVKQQTNEHIYNNTISQTDALNDALEALRKEVVISAGTNTRRMSTAKPILRQSGGLEAGSVGDRLVERLGDLVDYTRREAMIQRVNNIKTKEDLEAFIASLHEQVKEKMHSNKKEAKEEVQLAISYFASQIKSIAQQTRELKNIIEKMRALVEQLMLEEIKQDLKTQIFHMSKTIEGNFNKDQSHFTHEIINNIKEFNNLILESDNGKFSKRTTTKLKEFRITISKVME